MAIRRCILDKGNERFIVIFDEANYGPAFNAIARWEWRKDIDFNRDDADAMQRSILLFSPQTPPPRKPT